MGAGSTWMNSARGASWACGIGGSGPNCAVGHFGTYINCGWDAAGKGGWGTGGASHMVRGVKRNVQRYSSSAGVNLQVVDTIGLSPVIGWGFGEWIKVVGAIRGLATGYSSLKADGS